MNRKIILLIVLSLVLTGGLSFAGLNSKDVAAASTFQKVNYETGVVTAEKLNVRQGPSTNFPVVCVLKKGQSVKIFGKLGDWYAIYVPNDNCVGVTLGKYIKTAQAPQATAKKPAEKAVPKVVPKAAPKAAPKASPKPAPKPAPKQNTGTTGNLDPKAVASPMPNSPPSGVTQEHQELLNLVNKARADAGLAPLQFDMKLMEVAKLKAEDMVQKNYFSHQSPTYGSPFDMMKQFGVEFKTAGENIAGNRTVAGAFKAWMESEGHRKNILNGNFNYTGIGIVDSPKYGKMFAHMFIGK